MGVFLSSWIGYWLTPSLPHVRGGVSKYCIYFCAGQWSSPRAWGCFSRAGPVLRSRPVFPTCVGVFLSMPPDVLNEHGLPHVRGGVSYTCRYSANQNVSSPRAWGCFSKKRLTFLLCGVFPTCVGVFLYMCVFRSSVHRLPHVRGGVSTLFRL